MTKTEYVSQDKPDIKKKASIIELSNQDKIDIAKMFIQSGSDWLMFFSERRWMVLKNSVGAMLAVASASLFNNNKLAFISLVIGIAVSATVYLVKNHSYDKLINSLKDRIHEALLCYEKDVYFDGDSLFPDSHKKRDSRVANYTFIAVIWIVAMTSIFAIMVKKKSLTKPCTRPLQSVPLLQRRVMASVKLQGEVMKKILIALFTIFLSGCINSLDQKNLEYMADLTLCEQQKFNSDQLTLSWGLRAGGRSIESIQSDLKLLSTEINRKGIDCPRILSLSGTANKTNGQSKMVNCFPNQATGGVTCF